MSDKTKVETIYGKHYAVEIWRESHVIADTTYIIGIPERDEWRSGYTSLADAMAGARRMAGLS